MSFLDGAKRFASAITLFSASVISIGFSSWQFQNDSNGVPWSPESWDTICDTYPNDILRPVSVKITGYDDPSYCGYSNGNTGWRLATAIVTLLFSVCIFLKIFDERPALLTSLYWALYSCWFLAAGLDVVAVANGQASCKDSFDAINGTATCDNSVYGITIAIDVAICIVIGIFVYFQVRGGGASGSSSGTKMSNAV